MSWFSSWFSSNKAKLILNLGKQILRIFLGKAADKLVDVAKEEVEKAEASGKEGTEKYEIAFKGIKSRLGELGTFFLNIAIEIGVAALKAQFSR